MLTRGFFHVVCTCFASLSLSLLTLWPDVVLAAESEDFIISGSLQSDTTYSKSPEQNYYIIGDGNPLNFDGPGIVTFDVGEEYTVYFDASSLHVGADNVLNFSSQKNRTTLSMVPSSILEINAGNGDTTAVVNLGNGQFKFESQDEEYDDRPKINVENGVLKLKQNNERFSYLCMQYNAELTVGEKGLVSAPGIESAFGGHIQSNGNIATERVHAHMGGVIVENSPITIDGIGGTVSTRAFISTSPGNDYYEPGRYEGDVTIDVENMDGRLTIGGIHKGDVTLVKGSLKFWRGGVLDGNLTIAGGQGEFFVPEDVETPDKATELLNKATISGGIILVQDGLSLTLAKGMDISSGQLSAGAANLSSNGDIAIADGASADIGTLSAFNNRLLIGSENDTKGGASLAATNLGLGAQGKLLMDPPWGLAPANAAIENLGRAGQAVLEGQIGVGMNSMLALGTRDLAWLPDAVREATGNAGLGENGVKSAFGLYRPLQVASGGKLMVDGGKTSAQIEDALARASANTATFASKSMLALNGRDPEMQAGKAAIAFDDANGAVAVHDGAQLFISKARPGVLYKVVNTVVNPIQYYSADGATEIEPESSTAWEGENLRASSDMINLTYNGDGTVKAETNDSQTVYPDLSPGAGGAVNEIYAFLADPDSPHGGVRFLSRATDNEWNGGVSPRESASVIESASRMAVIGAIPQMALAANEAAAKAVDSRLGVARSGLLNEDYESGLGLWVMPLYRSANGFGLEADNLDHDFSGALGGVALGADWSFSGNLRAGLAFNIGGGYAKGSGDMQDTENRMSFWGLGAYAGWRPGDFGLIADFGLTSTYNRLKQDLPGFMGMDELKSDVEALVLSGGLRAEYAFHAGALDITPHAGVRYHYLRASSHDIKSGGSTIIKADSFDQNIWTFPVGIAFGADVGLSGGWSLRPALDLAVTPAAGDIKAKTKARFTGTSHEMDLNTQTMDWVTYGGTAGLELAKDNLSLSVFYSGQFGPHSSAHGLNAAFRYEF